jgi:LacI family transcriptional regulator
MQGTKIECGAQGRATKVRNKEPKPTINDVARLSGVSKKTVSRVINKSSLLNDATRDKVQAVIAQLGYVPNPQARALALRRNFLIGLIHDNPNAQTVLTVQEGMLEVMKGTEFALVVRPFDRKSPNLLEDIRHFIEQQRLYGVYVLPPVSENQDLGPLCRELGCRYVRMGSGRLDDAAHMVESNDREAVREGVEYLIAQGHRQIAHVAGPEGFLSAQEREGGLRDALAAHGLDLPENAIARGNYTFESGYVAAQALLAADVRPTAIFAANDEMAAAVLHAARQIGLEVPRDLSILGFDDTPIAAHIWPPMTTVRWPIRAMAQSAAMKLVHPEQADEQPSFFRSDLVIRASIAPPVR